MLNLCMPIMNSNSLKPELIVSQIYGYWDKVNNKFIESPIAPKLDYFYLGYVYDAFDKRYKLSYYTHCYDDPGFEYDYNKYYLFSYVVIKDNKFYRSFCEKTIYGSLYARDLKFYKRKEYNKFLFLNEDSNYYIGDDLINKNAEYIMYPIEPIDNNILHVYDPRKGNNVGSIGNVGYNDLAYNDYPRFKDSMEYVNSTDEIIGKLKIDYSRPLKITFNANKVINEVCGFSSFSMHYDAKLPSIYSSFALFQS